MAEVGTLGVDIAKSVFQMLGSVLQARLLSEQSRQGGGILSRSAAPELAWPKA
jgi:hypothetical protein